MSFLNKKLTLNATTQVLNNDIGPAAAFHPFAGPDVSFWRDVFPGLRPLSWSLSGAVLTLHQKPAKYALSVRGQKMLCRRSTQAANVTYSDHIRIQLTLLHSQSTVQPEKRICELIVSQHSTPRLFKALSTSVLQLIHERWIAHPELVQPENAGGDFTGSPGVHLALCNLLPVGLGSGSSAHSVWAAISNLRSMRYSSQQCSADLQRASQKLTVTDKSWVDLSHNLENLYEEA